MPDEATARTENRSNCSEFLSAGELERCAVELFESGKSVAEIARDLDVNPLSIYEWKRQAERTSGLSPQRVPTGVLLFLLAVGILLVAVPVLFRLLIITAETVVDGGVK